MPLLLSDCGDTKFISSSQTNLLPIPTNTLVWIEPIGVDSFAGTTWFGDLVVYISVWAVFLLQISMVAYFEQFGFVQLHCSGDASDSDQRTSTQSATRSDSHTLEYFVSTLESQER